MTKAMKVWGTAVTFHGYSIGEIEDVGKAAQSREVIEIFTCDSANESSEYLSGGITRGQITFQCVFDGETSGTFYNLQTDFDADVSDTLLITFKNGATKSIAAKIVNLETAGGAAKGGHMQYSVTFQLSGAMTYTPAAAA